MALQSIIKESRYHLKGGKIIYRPSSKTKKYCSIGLEIDRILGHRLGFEPGAAVDILYDPDTRRMVVRLYRGNDNCCRSIRKCGNTRVAVQFPWNREMNLPRELIHINDFETDNGLSFFLPAECPKEDNA